MATGQVLHNVRETNERLTGPPARKLIESAHAVDSTFPEIHVLDNACGSGILTRELFDLAQQRKTKTTIARVVAADIDERMLEYVTQLSRQSGWHQVETAQFDQASVPLEDASFTHVLSNFGVFFSADDRKVLSETLRLLRPDGIAGFTSWKYLGWWHDIAMPVLKRCTGFAASIHLPSKGWNDAETVQTKLEAAGLKDVNVEELEFTPATAPDGFAAACALLLKGLAARLWPTEINANYADRIEPEILRFLEETYEGGRWTGTMVALVATGRKEG